MEFANRSPAAAADDGVAGGRLFPDAPLHGDTMVVVRDALLSQLQQDRLPQEVIVAEPAKIERAMALRDASPCRRRRRRASSADGKTAATETVAPKKPSSSVKSEVTGTTTPVQSSMPPSAWSCAVCEVRTTSERNLRDHCGGQKHQLKVAELEKRTTAMAGQKAKTTAKAKTHTTRWSCSICQVNCTGEWDFDVHLKGQKHQANTQALLEQSKKNSGNSESQGTKVQQSNVNQNAGKKAATWICRVCEAHCTCESDLQNHLKGKRHQLNLQALNTSSHGSSSKSAAASKMIDEQTALYFCKVCSLKCTSERMLSDHLRGKKHSKQEGLLAFCEVCNLQCNSEKMLADHCNGKKHQANLNAKK
ncbi:hypothetical protein E2562_008289 [Oryza meyeriana var. granulata]|uniref:C2H2-type domain-containing protein n=1 Tax=Oryza meyeriana var. granulata TaxID=110450 RepID=A0A6G1DG35_9ORYZ|nr:hypothetical protein E2562_008289 [Oryza meyeriana var. granulata]